MKLKIQTLQYAPGAMLEYVVQDGAVVYCGITDIRQLTEGSSTTNAAGEILQALAKAVGKPVDTLTFFELLTHTSWVLRSGEYDFQNVKLDHGYRKEGILWARTQASEAILEAFRHCIGGGAARKYAPDPREAINVSFA